MDYRTSIIIVSHNNFDITTGPCLKSLQNDKAYEQFEIIIVDNGSEDGSSCKLQYIASKEKNVKLVLNDTNRGFAGGNNDGVNIAQGEVVILLNSDTIIPPGSIGKLTNLLIENTNWAMLGPVTNEAGNEQKIFVQSNHPEQIVQEGKTWCCHSNRSFFRSESLGFFCIAMLKETYDKLDGLDENFGLGYYEDTDFCIRAKQMGLNMMFTEDVFVCHTSGKSFSKMGNKFIRKLMRENRRKLEKKHSHRIQLYHMRERNINIMKQYVMLKENKTSISQGDLDYRFCNRLMLAKSMYPNNPIKKLFYYSQLKHLCMKYYQ